jgi:hypothetical protein
MMIVFRKNKASLARSTNMIGNAANPANRMQDNFYQELSGKQQQFSEKFFNLAAYNVCI